MAEIAANFREFGVTGLRRDGGVVRDEYLSELQGNRWLGVIREMADDPTVGAILFAVEMLLRRVPLNVQPADDSPAAADLARFVEECLGDMSLDWRDTLAEILTMLPYGWAYLELVYKRRGGDADDPESRSKYEDGRIGWRKWSIRSQETRERWQFDDSGGIQGMWQRTDGGQLIYIPIEKALLFRANPRKGNPEGRSVLRSSYRAWWFKRNIETIEGVGIERDLAGLPVAYVPPSVLAASTDDEQRQLAAIKEIVTNIRRDEQEGVIWPLVYDDAGHELYRLELLSSGGSRSFDTGAIIQRYEQRIAMTVLADFILLGHEAVGSYALSATKSSMFKTALEAWLESIAAVINTHAVPRLLRLNGLGVRIAPRVQFGAVGSVDVDTVIQFVSSMASAGMGFFPSPELENKLRGDVGLPPLTDDDLREREEQAQAKADARERMAEMGPGQEGGMKQDGMRQERRQGEASRAEMAAMLDAAQRILARGAYDG
jgi:hypothetical protein